MLQIGKRLSQLTDRKIQQMIYRPLLEAVDADGYTDMLDLNKAHLIMLAERDLIPSNVVRSLARTMHAMSSKGSWLPGNEMVPEDPYFAFEQELSQAAGIHHAGYLHLARSRNDIGATLDRMKARRVSLAIQDALLSVRYHCLAQVERGIEVVMPGYTHLQPAQPITFGYLMAGYETALERDMTRIADAYTRMDECAMGVAALAGTGFPIDRNRTAYLLGFSAVTRHGIDTVGSRDFVTELLYAVAQLGVTWNRICQDLHTFVSDEFSSIGFPDSVAGISSIMPQKKNPVVLEFLRAQSARSLGALTGAMAAVRGTHFSVALDAMREGLTDAWRTLEATPDYLGLLSLVLETVRPQEERLLQRCHVNFSTATDLADQLVAQHGLPFREAHHLVGRLVSLALEDGRDARGLDVALFSRASLEVLGYALDGVDDAFLRTALDPRIAVSRRTGEGGTSPSAVHRALQQARQRLHEDQNRVVSVLLHLAQSKSRLHSAVENLAAD